MLKLLYYFLLYIIFGYRTKEKKIEYWAVVKEVKENDKWYITNGIVLSGDKPPEHQFYDEDDTPHIEITIIGPFQSSGHTEEYLELLTE